MDDGGWRVEVWMEEMVGWINRKGDWMDGWVGLGDRMYECY